MVKTRTAKTPVKQDSIATWRAAASAVLSASMPPAANGDLRDIYGNPARILYDDAMRLLYLLERATFALANEARSAGHPHGALDHLRASLGVLLLNPMTNKRGDHLSRMMGLPPKHDSGYRIDVSDIGLGALLKDIDIARFAVLSIEQRRMADRSIGFPGEVEGHKEIDVATITGDLACQRIAKALRAGPMKPGALRTSAKNEGGGIRDSERTIGERLKWMRDAGLIGQAKRKMPYSLTDEGRIAFRFAK